MALAGTPMHMHSSYIMHIYIHVMTHLFILYDCTCTHVVILYTYNTTHV